MDELIYDNQRIKYETVKDGRMKVNIADCAIALGRTETKTRNGSTTCSVQWNRVYRDLVKFGAICECELKSYKENLYNKYIFIEDAILWSSLINTKKSKPFMIFMINIKKSNDYDFIDYFKDESIRIQGIIKRKEEHFFDLLSMMFNELGLKVIPQYKVLSYRLDVYIPELNIAIEYDENNHKKYTYEQHELRQKLIEKELRCRFIRVTDEYHISKAVGIVLKEIFINELKVS